MGFKGIFGKKIQSDKPREGFNANSPFLPLGEEPRTLGKDYHRKIFEFTKAIKDNPEDAHSYLQRGKCKLILAQAQEKDDGIKTSEQPFLRGAIDDFKNALKHDSGNSEALTLLGLCMNYSQDFKGGIDQLASNNYGKACDCFTKALQEDPLNPVLKYYRAVSEIQLAKAANTAKEKINSYEDACCDLAEAMRLGNKSAAAFYQYGLALYKLERYDDAIGAFGAAIELDKITDAANKPEETIGSSHPGIYSGEHQARKSHYFQGNCFLKLKRYEEAVSDYKTAINEDPGSPDAWHRLAHAYRCMHEHADALSCVEKAIELNPSDAYAFNLKASILLESDDFLQYRQFLLTPLKPIESVYYKIRENIRKVIEGYSKAIEITPEYSEALEKRGKVYLFLGNHDKSNGIDESGNLKNAIDDFKKSVFLGRKVESHYWLGVAYHLNSDFNEAQLHFKEALEACGEGKLKSKITEILETESNHQKLQIAMLQDKGFKVSANK